MRGGDLGDQLVDAAREQVGLRGERVDLVEQHLGELGVEVVEATGESLDERGVLLAHLSARELGEDARVTLSRDQRVDHRPARDAHDVGRDRGELDQRVLQELLEPLHMPRAVLDEIDPQPCVVTKPPDLRGRNELAPQHPALVQPREPDRVELVGLRRPGAGADRAGRGRVDVGLLAPVRLPVRGARADGVACERAGCEAGACGAGRASQSRTTYSLDSGESVTLDMTSDSCTASPPARGCRKVGF